LNLGLIILAGILLTWGVIWFSEDPGIVTGLVVMLVGSLLISFTTLFFKEAHPT